MLFRELGRCKEDYFQENCQAVLSKTVSLQTLLKNSEDMLKLQKTEQNAVLAAGGNSIQELKDKYPGKFDQGVLENFVGAEVYGKKANLQGDLLKSYAKAIKSGTSFEAPIKLEMCENILEITANVLNIYDVVVFKFDEYSEKYVEYLVDYVGNSYTVGEGNSKSFLLLLKCESELLKVLSFL